MATIVDLSAFFQTKAQATDFSSRIATVSEKIYETDFDLEKVLMEQFGLRKKEHFLTLLRDHNVSADSPTSLKQFLTDIQKDITTLKVLTLKFAFEPKEQTLKALSEWFVMNIKRQVLFDITVDPSIIAGAVISFNGKDTDCSIKEKFHHIVDDFVAKSHPENTVTVNLPHPDAKANENQPAHPSH